MKPNPISPSYLHDEYSVEDDADNDSPDTNSKLPPTISSSPRRLLPDEDGMDVGGGSDEEQSTNTSPQGSKRMCRYSRYSFSTAHLFLQINLWLIKP